MKTKISILIAAVLCLVSCDLDKKPLSQLSPDSFFSTEAELQAFSNNFYDGIFPSTEIYGEQSDLVIKLGLTNEMQSKRTIPESGSGWTWSTLRNFNTLIEYSVNCKDENVRNKYVALARFFRAYFYFEKVKRFGDVPYFDKQLGSDSPELYKPRDSRELVMDKIIEDLDFAATHLSATRDSYRITKWTALALKSRACLFEGTFRKYHAGTSYLKLPDGAKDYTYYLDQAVKAAEEFIDLSGYSVYTGGGTANSYRDLFAMENAASEEIILARDYYFGEKSNLHNGTYYTLGSYGKPSMTRKMACHYLMADGSRYTDQSGWETKSFVEETKKRDPRMSQSIRTGNYKRINGTKVEAPSLELSLTGYQPHKYMMAADLGVDAYGKSYNDLPIFRSAEVFLNFAEALAELEGATGREITQADIDKSIKKLRDRVGMPNLNVADANAKPDNDFLGKYYPNVTGPNKGIILEIRRERAVELFMENHRYYDVIRWKNGSTFKSQNLGMYVPGIGKYDLNGDGTNDVEFIENGGRYYIKAANNIEVFFTEGNKGYIITNNDIPGNWNEERDYFYPIPTRDRLLTNGVITQNPGWDDGLSF